MAKQQEGEQEHQKLKAFLELVLPDFSQEEIQLISDYTSNAWGKIVFNNSHNTVLLLYDSLITFGRGEQCNVCTENETVSNFHCQICYFSDNLIYLEDYSTNGTYLN